MSQLESNNLNSIKKQLQLYSLSTSTIGLIGEDRYEELKSRLESYENQIKSLTNSNRNNKQIDNNEIVAKLHDKDIINVNDNYQVSSLNNLSIGEIRSRLTMLG